MRRIRTVRRLAAAASLAAVLNTPIAAPIVHAQGAPPGGAQRATREQLTEQVSNIERQLPGARSGDRAKLQASLAAVKARLEQGDFKPGDRFVMVLRQDSVRGDTLVVRDSLRVAVLNLPEFSVAGILRAELEDKLNAHVGRYLRNASVRTTQLVRVSVTGAVRNPGFLYAVPDRPLNDLLTSAGGPLMEANLGRLTVSRVGKTFIDGGAAQRAVEQGRTLEELDIESGDAVYVPVKRRVDWRALLQLGFIAMSLMFGVLNFLRWYYDQQNQ